MGRKRVKPDPEQIKEDERLRVLKLLTEKLLKLNYMGLELGWHGIRLKMLMDMYDKSSNDIALIARSRVGNVNAWIKNLEKPSDAQISLLGFLFELPAQFFTNDEVTITIVQQKEIRYERNNEA